MKITPEKLEQILDLWSQIKEITGHDRAHLMIRDVNISKLKKRDWKTWEKYSYAEPVNEDYSGVVLYK